MLKSKKLDFLDELAKAVDLSEEGLQVRADDIIRGGETELKKASSEGNVKAEMAEIWGDKEATILRPSNDEPTRYPLARISDA